VARIQGFGALPSTPLPAVEPRPGGVLTPLQARARIARRALAASGWREAVTWSFTARDKARLFGGGHDERLIVANPIAADLDCMRPSALPNLIEAVGRSASRGFPDAALFEIGPLYLDATAAGQKLAAAGILAAHPPRDWQGSAEHPLYRLKGDLMALLEELGAPSASLQTVQGEASAWWHPGRSASLKLGPKTTLAEFGELHPRVLKGLDVAGPVYGFELLLGACPKARRKGGKTRSALAGSALMPLSRDFAFVVPEGLPAGRLQTAAAGADKTLIAEVRVFDVYQGAGVPEGSKSVALEVRIQPRDKTLTDAEIEALSAKVVAAAAKLGAALRS
jgi:phenylalanyl-tRNA synthetase beta chain